jgi:uncharacterized delta-60 repeat protein
VIDLLRKWWSRKQLGALTQPRSLLRLEALEDRTLPSATTSFVHLTASITSPTQVVQPDGKVLVAHAQGDSSSLVETLSRFNGDGTLDAGFGEGGIVTIAGASSLNALTLQPDGDILAVADMSGQSEGSSPPHLVLLRFNPDGQPDNQFGAGGRVLTSDEGGPDEVSTLTIGTDGKIVLTSTHTQAATFTMILFNADGTPDTTFGPGGMWYGHLGTTTTPMFSVTGTWPGVAGGDRTGQLSWFLIVDPQPAAGGHLSLAGRVGAYPSGPALPLDHPPIRSSASGTLSALLPLGSNPSPGAVVVPPITPPAPPSGTTIERPAPARGPDAGSILSVPAALSPPAISGPPAPGTAPAYLTPAASAARSSAAPASSTAELNRVSMDRQEPSRPESAAGPATVTALASPEDLAIADAFFAQGDFTPVPDEEITGVLPAALAAQAISKVESTHPALHPASWWPWFLLLVAASGGVTCNFSRRSPG